MKPFLMFILIAILVGCNSKRAKLVHKGDVMFRITYNYNRELTPAEEDSLFNSKPVFNGSFQENNVYDLLVRKGLVAEEQLDTSFLDLHTVSFENPDIHISGSDFNLETDTIAGKQHLNIAVDGKSYKVDLGNSLLGDRWVSLMDINDDDKFEILVLEKYYIIGGDNFDLKVYEFLD